MLLLVFKLTSLITGPITGPYILKWIKGFYIVHMTMTVSLYDIWLYDMEINGFLVLKSLLYYYLSALLNEDPVGTTSHCLQTVTTIHLFGQILSPVNATDYHL